MKKFFVFILTVIISSHFFCITGFAGENIKSLAKPQPVILTNKKNALKLSWVSVKGADYYVIYRTDGNPNGKYKLIARVKSCYYIDKVPENNKTYYYFVRAKGEGNIQSNSKVVYCAVVPLGSAKLTAVEQNKENIRLNWSIDKNASYYKIYRKSGNGDYSLIGTSVNLSYNDENILQENTLYYYRIVGIKKLSGKEYTSSYSNEAYLRTSDEYQKNKIPEIDNEWTYFLANKDVI